MRTFWTTSGLLLVTVNVILSPLKKSDSILVTEPATLFAPDV